MHLAHKKEGYEVAEWFAREGYTCFVLHYHVPKDRRSALKDAHSAIFTVRKRAEEWKLNPQKIGLLGFSAGGHLAAHTACASPGLSTKL